MRAIPTIRTARLTLRSMRLQDFERYAEIWQRSGGAACAKNHPWDGAEPWQAFLRNAGHWQMTGFGHWAIEPHGERRMMGQVGFSLSRDGADEALDAWPEAGWLLHPEAHGCGFGYDAVQAAHDWFDRVITGPLVCRISPQNERSMSIAELLGYVPARSVPQCGEELILFFRKSPPGGPRNLLD